MAHAQATEAGGLSAADATLDAAAAGLRYVRDDTTPGIRRLRKGRGFAYVDPEGRRVGPDEVRRIRALAIPPAWTDVWIAPSDMAHIQATGRDTRGRKQYIYHARWRELRDATKFDRLTDFAEALPRIRRAVDHDMDQSVPQERRVLAAVVRLLDTTSVRIGNTQYANENNSFGLTTLRSRHVRVSGTTLQIEFVGKSGKLQRARVSDRRLARIIRECQEIPGYELFQYLDATGTRRSIDSAHVNAYLREISGHDITAKDFRTWAGTLMAFDTLCAAGVQPSVRATVQTINAAIDAAAENLGNTRAVARRSYIHPAVLENFEAGTLPPPLRAVTTAPAPATGLSASERHLQRFLTALKRRKAA
jgi:DNA topoisomerase-1